MTTKPLSAIDPITETGTAPALRVAHSKTEYKRLKEQGVNVEPPSSTSTLGNEIVQRQIAEATEPPSSIGPHEPPRVYDPMRGMVKPGGGRQPAWIEEELKDGDRICEAAGVQRTEGGRLPVAKIIGKLSAAAPSSTRPMTRDQIERMRSVLIESMTDSEGEYPEEVETIVDMALKWIEHGEAQSATRRSESGETFLGENDYREVLMELADLMDDVVSGDYKPDSFTTQPARALLRRTDGTTKEKS